MQYNIVKWMSYVFPDTFGREFSACPPLPQTTTVLGEPQNFTKTFNYVFTAEEVLRRIVTIWESTWSKGSGTEEGLGASRRKAIL